MTMFKLFELVTGDPMPGHGPWPWPLPQGLQSAETAATVDATGRRTIWGLVALSVGSKQVLSYTTGEDAPQIVIDSPQNDLIGWYDDWTPGPPSDPFVRVFPIGNGQRLHIKGFNEQRDSKKSELDFTLPMDVDTAGADISSGPNKIGIFTSYYRFSHFLPLGIIPTGVQIGGVAKNQLVAPKGAACTVLAVYDFIKEKPIHVGEIDAGGIHIRIPGGCWPGPPPEYITNIRNVSVHNLRLVKERYLAAAHGLSKLVEQMEASEK